MRAILNVAFLFGRRSMGFRRLQPKENPLPFLESKMLYGPLLKASEIQDRSPLLVETPNNGEKVLEQRIDRIETRLGKIESLLGDHLCANLWREFDQECKLRYHMTYDQLRASTTFERFRLDFGEGGRPWSEECENFLAGLKEVRWRRLPQGDYQEFAERSGGSAHLVELFRAFIDRTAPQ